MSEPVLEPPKSAFLISRISKDFLPVDVANPGINPLFLYSYRKISAKLDI